MADYRKKLIEVALPLEAINRESAREKSIRHGHPSTLHLWWARRPLAACRAVLFASIVDDPSSRPDVFPTDDDQQRERQRLFRLIEELVKWENSNNETVLAAARAEIMRATNGHPPQVLDPFCGGGSIPLEAQRLGLEAHASDLNPVAVLITKAMVELPPLFADKPPVNPEARAKLTYTSSWIGAQGLADDVRYYGKWIRDKALKRIGHLYPAATLSDGHKAQVIAWLWARTVRCPNPACRAHMPLVRSFALSTKKNKEWHVLPLIDHASRTVAFTVKQGKDVPESPKIGRGANFRCLVCGEIADEEHVKSEGMANRIGAQLLAMVVEGDRRRIYLAPDAAHEAIAKAAPPTSPPSGELAHDPRNIWCVSYGLTHFADLFTARQLVALTTMSDLVGEARQQILVDGGDDLYADALAVYLALLVSRESNYCATLCVWSSHAKDELAKQVFMRQALPMTWDFAETNPFATSGGTWESQIEWLSNAVERLPAKCSAKVRQLDATSAINGLDAPIIATDPPYYDNIAYADLSDFFYIWLRRALAGLYPDLFSTLLTPKSQELIATPYRFGGDRKLAEDFFESGLSQAFARTQGAQNPEYPLTLFYAFKQVEFSDGGMSSSGWDTMLTGLLDAGFVVTGTWPVRSELVAALKKDVRALASSIVLVCRPRPLDAPIATRRELVDALRTELPGALATLQRGNIAPVDLAQASIGPGMAVFSRYAKVLEADGSPMAVRAALRLINQALDEILAEQEGDFDSDTRFAVTWFEQRGFDEGPYGEAEVLARAKDTSLKGLEEAGFSLRVPGRRGCVGATSFPATGIL